MEVHGRDVHGYALKSNYCKKLKICLFLKERNFNFFSSIIRIELLYYKEI